MSEEMKSCPFCGGPAETGGYVGAWYIRCASNDCYASIHGSHYLELSDAIAAWNTRSPVEAELREALQAMLDDYRTEGCPDPNCGICSRSKAALDKARRALCPTDTADEGE